MKSMYKYIMAVCTLAITTAVMGQTSTAAFKVPAYQKFSLPNGLTVYLMEQHEVPMINVSAIIPAGAIYDGDKNGLASLTATCLQNGTRSYTKPMIEEQLDFVGATMNTYASKESAGLAAKFAAKDQEKIFPLLAETLIEPAFNNADFEKEKTRTLTRLEQSKESPRAVIGNYWDKLLYGDHVYSNPVAGRSSSVSLLTTDDLKKFYQDNYSPNGSAIAIVGDFNSKDMKATITKLFGSWKKKDKPASNLAAKPVASPDKASVLLVNKDDAREATFYIGGKGVSRNNPDYVALEVVNTAFGGRFTSWLNDELRVNSGLTYGASSGFSMLKNAGTFRISTFTATKTTGPTIDLALKVLDSLHKNGFDESTLASARNYVKGQFPPGFETSGQLAGLLTQMFWYGFNESFINNFQKNVDELTVDKAKAIIAKYFPKDGLQMVVVGKASDIKKVVEKYGPVKEVQIKEEPKKAF